jgi:predicted ATPase
MNIRAVKLRISTARGEFGFKFQFSCGLTVIRGSNSSGKSTLFNTESPRLPWRLVGLSQATTVAT